MKWIQTIVRELIALFVDSVSFVLLLLLWIAFSALVLPHVPSLHRWTGTLLFAGLGCILAGSAVSYAHQRDK